MTNSKPYDHSDEIAGKEGEFHPHRFSNSAHQHHPRPKKKKIREGNELYGYLFSTRSVLLPTSTMITSLPRSVRTSSIHFEVFKKDCLPVISKKNKACELVTESQANTMKIT